MKAHLKTAATYVLANAIGLLIAVIILPDFSTGFLAFFVAVLVFAVVQVVAGPLIRGASKKWAPKLMGGITLITIFAGLGITSALVGGMTISGISSWLAATLIVWLGSLLAETLLPVYVLKSTPPASE